MEHVVTDHATLRSFHQRAKEVGYHLCVHWTWWRTHIKINILKIYGCWCQCWKMFSHTHMLSNWSFFLSWSDRKQLLWHRTETQQLWYIPEWKQRVRLWIIWREIPAVVACKCLTVKAVINLVQEHSLTAWCYKSHYILVTVTEEWFNRLRINTLYSKYTFAISSLI